MGTYRGNMRCYGVAMRCYGIFTDVTMALYLPIMFICVHTLLLGCCYGVAMRCYGHS